MGTSIKRSSTRHSNGTLSHHHVVVRSHPGVEAPRFDNLETVMRRSHPPEPRHLGAGGSSGPRPIQQPTTQRRRQR